MTASPCRAIVEVRFGPMSTRKLVVDPGTAVKIGRAEPADLVVANDKDMSAEHFALSWDGKRCRVRDLRSAQGTFVQGARVDEAEVGNGAWIKAGTTNLMVYFEKRGREEHWTPDLLRVRDTLRAESGTLFAVVDAAQGIEPLTLLRESVDRHQSLYDGVRGEALALVAPYLVELRRDSELLDRLVHGGWAKPWALYLSCARPFLEVRRHLRRFLVIEREDQAKKFLLRYYDPRVLPVLLESSSPRQRQQLFGEITCFFVETATGQLARLTL